MAFQYALPPDPNLANYWHGDFGAQMLGAQMGNQSRSGGMIGGPVNAYGGGNQMQQQRQIPYQPFAYGQTGYTAASPASGLTNDFGGLMGAGASNPYDIVNAMSSGNMRAMYGPAYDYQGTVDTNRTQERMQQAQLGQQQSILSGILPAIISALGGLGGAGGGGMRTDYGAGFGSPAQPTNTQQFRRNPLLSALGG
jgi:hypothetical protein